MVVTVGASRRGAACASARSGQNSARSCQCRPTNAGNRTRKCCVGRISARILGAVVSQMRAAIYEAVTDVLATLQKREEQIVAPRSVMQLKNLIEQIRLLNFYDDDEVNRILTQLQGMLDLSPERRRRSAAEMQATLRAIATVVRGTLIDLEEEPRPARAAGIPDAPGGESIRAARMQLGLDLPKEGEAHAH